ncbi:MAG: GGDEF domain-containing protein [Betaproteobacteria bacterium]
MWIKTILEFPEKLPKPFLTFIGFLFVLAIGSLDSITSYDISVSLLYLFPIILIAWYEGGVPAAIISIFSAMIWAISDLVSGHSFSHLAIPLWNAIMVLGMFLIVAYSITIIKKLLLKEREHAHNDDLTSVTNIEFFYEQARVEISRSAIYKQPLTLAYLAIDNLKYVNESLGYMTGDYLIHEVAQTIKSTLRSTTLISRFGGAEFAILMPGTKKENATTIVHKVQVHLLEMVKKHGWPVTFSTGVVTCDGPTYVIDELINMAKNLMKAARETGKNTVKYKKLE